MGKADCLPNGDIFLKWVLFLVVMLYDTYDAQKIEPKVQEWWEEKKINEKVRKKNVKGPKFYFLDGPPYTSGRVHLGTAWNKSLKDVAIRYRKMKGDNVWDRNGFDMHGLPTELKVTAKHGLKTKEDIVKFGMDKFIKECEAFSREMAGYMIKDFKRLGVTLDFSDSYMPITKEFMEGEWSLIKKAWEQKRLYHGEKVMTWCAQCETALAKHECEYENVNEKSIFVKLALKGKKNEFLVIWTTTPWTIPFNLAVMAGPEIDYVKAEVEGEKWILAKALAAPVIQSIMDKKLKVVEEFKGKTMEGWEYEHPFEKEISKYAELKKDHPNVHTVILSDKYVDTTSGSGLVHAAPGCGPEDQEACKPYDIPPFNNLSEEGDFVSGMGKFSGWKAKKDDQKFRDALDSEGALIAVTPVEHEYPHCWRCHQPIIFRPTPQWFLKIEDLLDKMLKDNDETNWVPKSVENSFTSWVENLKDNSISRQRFWGTPLPIWECSKCKDVDVVGDLKELKKKSGMVPSDMHIPWVDEVVYKCACGGEFHRVPDVIDVWVDAGTTSWNCLYNDSKLVKEWFPANLILEAKEQTRLWYSMLSICSQIMYGKNCYENVYSHGMLTDIEGKKMSKSLGNIISPYELIDKHGADVLRYYMCQNNAGQEINFNWEECVVKERQLRVLWNVHKFLIDLSRENNTNPFELDSALMENIFSVEEQWIYSKLQRTIQEVSGHFEKYELDQTIGPIEELWLELSRTYIQIIREKSAIGSKSSKDVCLYVIGQTLLSVMKLFAPIAPFITEAMYQNFRAEFKLKEESIHHCKFPIADGSKIDDSLEGEMEIVKQVIQAGLGVREQMQLGVRWPLKELIVASTDEKVRTGVEKLQKIIMKQVNVKSINVMSEMPGVSVSVKPDYAKIGPKYARLSAQIIAKLSIDSPETIMGHLEKTGSYDFKIEGVKISIVKEDLLIESSVPEGYKSGEFRKGQVYVNLSRDALLDGEGYAREIMRIVQQLRKEAGLEKSDKIDLVIKVSEKLLSMIERFKSDIKEKVGALELDLSTQEPGRKLKHSGVKKVKGEEVKVWFGRS